MSAKLYKLITVLTSTSSITPHRVTPHHPSHFQTKKQIPPTSQLFPDKYHHFVSVSVSVTQNTMILITKPGGLTSVEVGPQSIITRLNNTMHQVFYCSKLLTRPSSLISWVALWKLSIPLLQLLPRMILF